MKSKLKMLRALARKDLIDQPVSIHSHFPDHQKDFVEPLKSRRKYNSWEDQFQLQELITWLDWLYKSHPCPSQSYQSNRLFLCFWNAFLQLWWENEFLFTASLSFLHSLKWFSFDKCLKLLTEDSCFPLMCSVLSLEGGKKETGIRT